MLVWIKNINMKLNYMLTSLCSDNGNTERDSDAWLLQDVGALSNRCWLEQTHLQEASPTKTTETQDFRTWNWSQSDN